MLRDNGADVVFIDSGAIATVVRQAFPNGVDKVLQLIGATTLKDSLVFAKQGGLVRMTGIVGDNWSFDNFAPMDVIPTAIGLTIYAGESMDFMRTPFDELIGQIEAGSVACPSCQGPFPSIRSVEAHRWMERKLAGGKIVVVTDSALATSSGSS